MMEPKAGILSCHAISISETWLFTQLCRFIWNEMLKHNVLTLPSRAEANIAWNGNFIQIHCSFGFCTTLDTTQLMQQTNNALNCKRCREQMKQIKKCINLQALQETYWTHQIMDWIVRVSETNKTMHYVQALQEIHETNKIVALACKRRRTHETIQIIY